MNTPRDIYRAKYGYAPSIITQLHVAPDNYHETSTAVYPDIEASLGTTASSGNLFPPAETQAVREEYRFVPVVVDCQKFDDCTSGDYWWLLQVSKPFEKAKTGGRCHIFGYWIEKNLSDDGEIKFIRRKHKFCLVIS